MSDRTKRTWTDPKLAFEVWKYYGSIGGTDKDTMIKIVTWLLGFSTAIMGFYATGKLTESFARGLLIMLGILVSVLAAFTALLYDAYATWNWNIADRIAEAYDWTEQKPDYIPFPSGVRWTLRLATPCQDGIAPVFWIFFGFSLVSLSAHLILLFHVL